MASTYPAVLSITPDELKVEIVLDRELKTYLQLRNISDKLVTFKVKTTAPKRYAVAYVAVFHLI